MNNTNLLYYGAPLNSAFRSLAPTAMAKNTKPANPQVPQPPELSDLTQDIYGNKELAALARYFNMSGSR